MKTRIISGLVMLPLLAIVFFGGRLLLSAGIFVAVVGVREFYNGFNAMGYKPSKIIGYVSIFLLYLFHIIKPGDFTLICLWMVVVAILSMIYGFNVEERKPLDMTSTLFGVIYVVFFSYHIVLIDMTEYKILIWLVFITAFGTDIMAYFTGITLGKHKLCPKLSPKKSIEGAIGGVVGSTVLCILFGYIFAPQYLIECIVIGIVGSVVAQLGDLSASAFKRQMGIKDYGNLIPGHGGILDRFDSVLFTAPLVYYCIVIINL